MPIQNVRAMRQTAQSLDDTRLEAAGERCNQKIAEAMARGANDVRVWTGLDYQESHLATRLDQQLAEAGYEVDGEMQLRHGYVLDITWPEAD